MPRLLWSLLFRLLLHLASSRTPKVRSSCRLVLRRSLASVIDVLCWWCRVRRRLQGAVQAALAAERVLSSLHHLLQRLQVRAAGDLWPHGVVRQVLHRLEDAREPDQVPLSAATVCCSSAFLSATKKLEDHSVLLALF